MKKRRQEREKERAAAQAEMVSTPLPPLPPTAPSAPLCSPLLPSAHLSAFGVRRVVLFAVHPHAITAVQEMMQRMKEAEMFSKWSKEEDEVCWSVLSLHPLPFPSLVCM